MVEGCKLGRSEVISAPYPTRSWKSRRRESIPYALETDWPVGAGGFEPPHLMRTHQDSPPRGRDSNLRISEFQFTETLNRGQDSNLRISMRKLVGSAALILMHRFGSCRPNRPGRVSNAYGIGSRANDRIASAAIRHSAA